MNFKKRVSGSWIDIPHYIHNTSTDTITTLPAVLYPNATTATVGLKGQAVQSSVPSPTSPVMPQGTGDKTANLFDSSSISLVPVSMSATRSGTNLGILPQGDYVLSATATAGAVQLYRTIKDGNNYTFETIRELPYTFTANGTSEQIIRTSGSNFTSWASTGYTNIMLNTGSTALPYELFGVKIPISSADTTTNNYLGEVETTRKIGKQVLTGSETWYAYSAGNVHQFYTQNMVIGGVASSSAYSTITPYGMTVDSRIGDYGCYLVSSGNEIAFQMYGSKADFPTQTEWKAYLAQQYAAGTPVTVWYVLATETTGIVNEPLMRIGDYADTLSNVSIPVTAGGDTISVGTTVQPSEVTATYKGWHPVADVHERTNGAWT